MKIGRNIWVSGWSRNWWHKHGKFMEILSHVNVKSPSSVELLPLTPLGFHHWKHPFVFLSSNSGSQTSSGILSGKKNITFAPIMLTSTIWFLENVWTNHHHHHEMGNMVHDDDDDWRTEWHISHWATRNSPEIHQKFTRFYSQIFPVPVPFYPWRLGLHFQLILGDLIGGWQAVELAGRLQLALVDHLHALHQNDEGEPETLHTTMHAYIYIYIWCVYIYIYMCV